MDQYSLRRLFLTWWRTPQFDCTAHRLIINLLEGLGRLHLKLQFLIWDLISMESDMILFLPLTFMVQMCLCSIMWAVLMKRGGASGLTCVHAMLVTLLISIWLILMLQPGTHSLTQWCLTHDWVLFWVWHFRDTRCICSSKFQSHNNSAKVLGARSLIRNCRTYVKNVLVSLDFPLSCL